MKVYSRKVFSLHFDIAGSVEAFEASKVFVRRKLLRQKMVDSLAVLPALLPVQIFVVDIKNFFANVYIDATLFEKCRLIPLLL